MQKTQKETNLSIALNIPHLNISENIECHSPEVQKIINELDQFKKHREVIYSYPEFLEKIMKEYEQGNMVVYNIHDINDLVNYLYQHYDIRKLKKPKEELKKTTLRSMLYDYKDLNK